MPWLSEHPLYHTWRGMKERCNNPHNKAYKHYGGRGIKVCVRWARRRGFAAFLLDMGDRPPGCTLDRIDVNGDYEPGNCRWASHAVQHRNHRRNIVVAGLCLKDYCESGQSAVSYETVIQRMRTFGWPLHRAIRIPSRLERRAT